MAASICAIAAACFPGGAGAAMKLEQMKLLKGAAQLEMTVDALFAKCGLPAAIVDRGATEGAKQSLHWQGVGMRLSAQDWEVIYGAAPSRPGQSWGWVNRGKPDHRCASGLSQLLLTAKGHVGVLTVKKKPNDIGYITTYVEPKNLYRSHKVIGAQASLSTGLPVSTLTRRYGQPDKVIKRPGSWESYRYWVLTLRENRPETLHAVDFEIDKGVSKSYAISTTGVDFVQQRLEELLKTWERDYVLD